MKVSRVLIGERFREARTFLSFTKQCESLSIPPIDSEEVKILRGMFYVNMYAVIEKSVSYAIEQFLSEVNALGLKNYELSVLFLPVAMNSYFKSIGDAGAEKKWQKRVDFVNAINSGEHAKIESLVFDPHLQSCTNSTIASVLSYIGTSSERIISSPDRHYIDEIVNKRHQIAHGRTSPATIGANGRSAELELRFNAAERTVEIFISQIEEYFNSYSFLNEPSRHRFVA